jgi:predicted CXXCH cytochrome family protein
MEQFNPPPDESSGMLGYHDPAAGQTTCGNCHVGMQAEWETTAHAHAYATLESSGQAQSFCYECHTVSDQGNPLANPAGWNVVQSEAYHDVQCENCHGAGLDHVTNPDATQPVPSLAVPAAFDNGCAECHSGAHHPFADEWSLSKHAEVVTVAAGRTECAGCHRGQNILEAWGEDANYLEKDATEHLAITCGVCHDPHETRNEGQLRFPVNTNSPELHLCARCHDRRTVPDPNSSSGLSPHAPETDLLLGVAGWFPPGANIDPGQIIASHGTEGNEKLCASCHVNKFTVTDPMSGDFVFNATGHLFRAIPCVDAQGIPTEEKDCNYTTTDRSFLACATTGCHATVDAAESALLLASTRIQNDADDLLGQLTVVDPNLNTAGGEIDPTTPTFTTAEGAYFNYRLATFGGGVHGSATHNPFLTEALLLASIDAVEAEYGVPPGSRRSAQEELRRLLARAGR